MIAATLFALRLDFDIFGRLRRMRRLISMLTFMAADAPARPGVAAGLAAVFVTLVVQAMLSPTPASAQFNFLDPVANAQATASGWFGQAQNIAQSIFSVLIVLEITMLGIQFALFRENFTEFIGSVIFKILSAGIFLWFISQAAVIFPAIINSFTGAAQQIDPNAGKPAMVQLAAKIFIAVVAIYLVPSIQQGFQQASTLWSGWLFWGTGDVGLANGEPLANNLNILFEQTICFLLLAALAVILLQWVLTTMESYIVMFAGVLFLGFAGSRWTMPFAQGYLSYAVNVGVKLFTLYLILSIENNLMNGVLVPIAGAVAIQVLDPTGVTGPAATALLFWAVMEVGIMSAVAYAIPSIAGSFLSGQSSLSGSQALSQMTGAVSGMAMMNAAHAGGHNSHIHGEQAGATNQSFQNAMSHHGAGAGGGNGRGGTDHSMNVGGDHAPSPVGALPGAAQGGNGVPGSSGVGMPGGDAGTSLYGGPSGGGVVIPFTPAAGGGGDAGIPGGGRVGTSTSPAALDASPSGAPATMPAASVGGGSGPTRPAVSAPAAASAAARPPSARPPASNGGGGGYPSPVPGGAGAPPPISSMNPSSPAYQLAASEASSSPSAASGTGFHQLDAATVAAMDPASVPRYVSGTDWGQVPASVAQAINDNPKIKNAIEQELSLERAQIRQQEAQSNAFALSALNSALPRGDAAPAAVQVRMSQADKL